MAYRVYNTEGIVLFHTGLRTADGMVTLYTQELGLITGMARSIRSMKSKLRYQLVPCSRVLVSVVRGKIGWRIIGAQDSVPFRGLVESQEKAVVIGRVFALLRRLTDEGGDPVLFNYLVGAFHFLNSFDITAEEIRRFEMLVVAEILQSLGYGSKDGLAPAIEWSRESLGAIEREVIVSLTKKVNETLRTL